MPSRHSAERRHVRRMLAVTTVAGLVAVLPLPALAYRPPGVTTRVSVGDAGQEPNDHVWNPDLSSDGRVVAFDTPARNLAAADTGGFGQVFARDLSDGGLDLVSRTLSGLPGNGDSTSPSLSADGRFVAFTSRASDLVVDDTNAKVDAFVLDRVTGVMERVSLTDDGEQVAADSGAYGISGDGRYVAFFSFGANLVPGDANNLPDIFVRDRVRETTELVSVATDGTQVNAFASQAVISADGRFVAFDSGAATLVPGDRNGAADVFVRDLLRGTTERVSVASDGTEGNSSSQFASISADGRFVAFRSFASNLVENQEVATGHVFVHDRATATTERVSVTSAGAEADSVSNDVSISADGRYVAFYSFGSRVVPGPSADGPDVFVHDRLTGATERVSASDDGVPADSWSTSPSISADGRFVAFRSTGSNLVDDDTNDVWDIFVRDRGGPEPVVTVTPDGGSVDVRGWARLAGATVARESDPRGDVPAGVAKLGLDIARAEVVYRPEDQDVLVRVTPTEIPSVRGPLAGPVVGAQPAVGAPGAAWAVRFRIGDATYEATATRLDPTPEAPAASRFELHRCTAATCEATAIGGGIATGRADVTLAIPIGLLEAPGPLRDVRVYSHAVGARDASGASIDELRLPDLPALRHGVRVGVGASRDAAEWTDAAVADGRFSATVRPPGTHERVWVEPCVPCGGPSD